MEKRKNRLLWKKVDLPLSKIDLRLYYLRLRDDADQYEQLVREYGPVNAYIKKDLDCLFRNLLSFVNPNGDILTDYIARIVVNDLNVRQLRILDFEIAKAYDLSVGSMPTMMKRMLEKLMRENTVFFRHILHYPEFYGVHHTQMIIAMWYKNNYYQIDRFFEADLQKYIETIQEIERSKSGEK